MSESCPTVMPREDAGLAFLAAQFALPGQVVAACRHGCGHINDTYAVTLAADTGSSRCILQRLNTTVFPDYQGVMHNIDLVTRQLQASIADAGGDPQRETLSLVPTTAGKTFLLTPEGECWRMYRYVERTVTFDQATPALAGEAAKAYATFARLLQELKPEMLTEPLPDFHNTATRFQAFERSLARATKPRLQRAQRQIEFILARADETDTLTTKAADGVLPSRVTHNDTKLNNILFDAHSGAGVCVVDLDTVMPGLLLYDFGDLVRSAATTAAEDEPDLSKVHFSLEIFAAIVRGYLEGAGTMLVPAELAQLCFAARLITLECGMRFLTDYLQGDVYFRTSHEHHNLERSRNQLKLVEEMELRSDEMQEVVVQAMRSREHGSEHG